MKITDLTVRRPVTGVMVFLCLTLLGMFTFSRLKLDMFPDLEVPIVAIITQYPGAGPEAVEQLVSRPIEEAMASVESVEKLNSTSDQDTSVVMVEFGWGSDMAQAEDDVRKNLDLYALDRLPDDANRPLTFAFDPSLQPIIFFTVNAPGSSADVRRLAEDEVEPYLERIPGVAATEIIGGVPRQIQVRLRPEWLEAYGIGVDQVIGALRGANVLLPGGRMTQGEQELNINANAQFSSVEQIAQVTVGQRNGVSVRLREVADVVDGFEEQLGEVRANGSAAVMMMVRKQSDANTVQVSQSVLAELEVLEKQLSGVSLDPIFDQGLPITRSISNLASSAGLAILFTALILLVFLRSTRTSAIVLVSIPLSLLTTFTVMDAQGITLNIISMAGLALAVGLLVDNSIVVLESFAARLEQGQDPKTAAIEGTTEVAMPIVAATLTTVAVFAPILFVPGLAGQLFRDMSLTICISLIASLLVALTLVPMLASLLVSSGRRSAFSRALGKLTGWLDPLSERYGRFLGSALRHRKKVFLAAVLTFVGSLGLATQLGVDFMAQTDESMIQIGMETAPGSSLATTAEVFAEAERITRELVPEAEVIVARFGGGDDFGALMGQGTSSGTLQVRLPPIAARSRSQFEIEDALMEALSVLPGVEVEVQAPGGGALLGGGGDIDIKLFSDDLEALQRYGERLEAALSEVPGTRNVGFSMADGKPELRVDFDREQIRLLGLTPAGVASTLSTYFLGTTATMYREDGDEHSVFVRAPLDYREDIEKLRSLPLVTPLGVTVPLSTVADIRLALGPTSITRENQRRKASVMVAAAGIPLGTLIQRVNETLEAVEEEPAVSTVVAGTAEDIKESFAALGLAILAAIVLVYMVMASQFESLLEPFVILMSIPLAISGVILALVVTGTTLQVTALIGIILLAGIVVNNGIVLIDVIKQRRYEGKPLVEAAVEAGRRRLRPILMTTLTTVLGMVPLALEIGEGAELWTPMARAVIGGMLVSTLLTLVVIPVFYVSLASRADARKRKKAEKRREKESAELDPQESAAA